MDIGSRSIFHTFRITTDCGMECIIGMDLLNQLEGLKVDLCMNWMEQRKRIQKYILPKVLKSDHEENCIQ